MTSMKFLTPSVAISLLLFALQASAALPAPGTEKAPRDPRYCGEPPRDTKGKIIRSEKAKRDFARIWPKPRDGRSWYIDHVVPMSRGGCDAPHNMQWLHKQIKVTQDCKVIYAKDCFELEVYNPER